MALALFDLDNTLLGGDSDYLWGRFLVEQGIVDGESYERENRRYYDQYKAGTLDIQAFLAFSLRPLAEHPPERLHAWRDEFLVRMIDPIILPDARALVERHRAGGDLPVIITAEVEMEDGRYTGRSAGIPCFQSGKVQRLEQWLADHGADLDGSWFYSDSHNDLPLLERVAHPVAVDPDDTLAHHARARGWPVMTLRRGWTGPAD